MPLEIQNRIIGVAGRKGSGKSTKVRELLERCDRFVIFDTCGEHNWVPERVEEREAATIAIMETERRETFMIDIVPTEDDLEFEFLAVCGDVYDYGNMLFCVEEVPILASPNYLPKRFGKVIRLGRHRGIDIVYTAQRLGECPRVLTGQTDIFILFSTTEPLDLDAIASRCGHETADRVRNLGLHEFLIWDVIERREIPADGDRWYSLVLTKPLASNTLGAPSDAGQ